MIKSITFRLIIYTFFLGIFYVQAQQLAFPTAEGFGKYSLGGRGGTVYHVTNLNNAGIGSFRDAISKSNRTIVFDVGGVINITDRLVFSSNLTIAGQTAPGDGISIYGDGVSYSNANNTITRYIRYRMGQLGTSGKDAIAIADGHDIIMDNVSVSWGRDGTLDVNGDVTNFTFQDGIVSQGLDPHSTGGLMQSDFGTSIVRTLYIDNHTRNPKVKGKNEFVNNIIYNWEVGGYILGDSEQESWANVIGNYFINGPSDAAAAFTRANANFHLYAANNFQDSNRNGKLDGSLIPTASYGPVTWQTSAYSYPTTKILSPANAYAYVVKNAGASLKRDQVDTRMIQELTSLGTMGEIVRHDNDAPMVGVGTVNGGAKLVDTDQDGMPDSWEKIWGLNINVADNNGDLDKDGYTNLEQYINCIVGEGNCVKVVTGLEESKEGEDLKVYPNPTSGSFNISINGEYSYQIHDLSSNVVEQGTGNGTIATGTNLPAGLYVVKISNQARNTFVKLAKE